ncbi:hypothetical protein G9A89_006798 [Geosiphon pyriformis]|nr:hypothetical protein G9A89_006798 [Geosiphon pyriformis]
MITLASSFSCSYLGSGLGLGSSFSDTLDLSNDSPSVLFSGFSLDTQLASLKYFLELLADQVSSLMHKLHGVNLVFLTSLSFSHIVDNSASNGSVLKTNMVLDNLVLEVLFSSSVISDISVFGSSSSKVLTTKVGCLEFKLVVFDVSVGSILMNLDKRFYDVGIAIIMDNSLAYHVSKIEDISDWAISVWLLFKGKLLVAILGLYAGASAANKFNQTLEINFFIAKTVNSSTFMVLGEDFNKNDSGKSANFKFLIKSVKFDSAKVGEDLDTMWTILKNVVIRAANKLSCVDKKEASILHNIIDNNANLDSILCHFQYAFLDYVNDNAFGNVMNHISSDEFLWMIKNLPDEKAAGLSGIPNKL